MFASLSHGVQFDTNFRNGHSRTTPPLKGNLDTVVHNNPLTVLGQAGCQR